MLVTWTAPILLIQEKWIVTLWKFLAGSTITASQGDETVRRKRKGPVARDTDRRPCNAGTNAHSGDDLGLHAVQEN